MFGKKIAKTIIDKDGDYILALKENHKTLYDETVLFFDKMELMKKDGYRFDEHTTVNGGHGRIETRKHVMTSDIGWFEDKDNWSGLKCFGMVESTREIKGECSHEKLRASDVMLKYLARRSGTIGELKIPFTGFWI